MTSHCKHGESTERGLGNRVSNIPDQLFLFACQLSGTRRDILLRSYRKGLFMTEHILRRREVEIRTGLSRSTIYEWMKRGDFPQPVKLGARLVGWRESDLNEWLEARETRTS